MSISKSHNPKIMAGIASIPKIRLAILIFPFDFKKYPAIIIPPKISKIRSQRPILVLDTDVSMIPTKKKYRNITVVITSTIKKIQNSFMVLGRIALNNNIPSSSRNY